MLFASRRVLLLMALAGAGGVHAQHAQQAEYLPLELLDQQPREGGIRMWKFDVFPSASLRGEYSDNITYLPTAGSGDFTWYLTPAFSAVTGTAKKLSLSYAPSAQFYTTNTRYNAINHSASVSLSWPINRLSLGWAATYSDSLSAQYVVGGMTRGKNLSTTLNGTYDLATKLSLSSNLRFTWSDYSGYSGAYATPAGGLIGYMDWGNDDWLRYRFTEKTSFSLGASVGSQRAQQGQGGQYYERLLASAAYQVSQKVSVTATVGPEWRQYGAGQADSVGLVFNLSGAWKPRDSTSLTLGASRSQSPSPVGAGQNYVNTSANFDVSQRILDRHSVSAGVGLNNVTSANSSAGSGVARDNNYLLLRTAFNTTIAQRWTFSLFYSHQQSLSGSSSGSSLYGFDNNRAGFELSWRY
jgi:hypothetical protein